MWAGCGCQTGGAAWRWSVPPAAQGKWLCGVTQRSGAEGCGPGFYTAEDPRASSRVFSPHRRGFGLTASYPLLFEDLMSKLMVLLIVGVAGFEPTTSSSRTKRATKLRHTPCAAGDSIASTHRREEIGSAESSVTSLFAP